MAISDNIKYLRTTAGLSQVEFGKLFGVSDKAVSTWENGLREPRMGVIQKMADRYGIKKGDIIDGDLCKSQNSAIHENLSLPSEAIPYNPTHRIPILGRISAGRPLYAEEQIEGYTYTELNHGGEYFALRVHGDSMNALDIKEGYLVIVRRQDIVENGEIAIVIVGDDEATIKRFYRTDDTITLMPQSSNPEHLPQIYDLKKTNIRVIGKVIEVKFCPK